MFAVNDVWRPEVVLGGAAVAGWLVAWLTGWLILHAAHRRYRRFLNDVHRLCHQPFKVTAVTLALIIATPQAGLHGDVRRWAMHGFLLTAIAACSWLLVKALFVAEDAAFNRLRVDVADNRRARRVRTQISLLRRLTAMIVTVLALATMLLTFGQMRAFGASILASAGLVGIVSGLAAQTTLANVFAGLQLAFTDALRIDDVVVVEEEWGRVEELTLTYVVVHLWDERRLVLPTSYFTSTPFQNWTRTEARVLGSVVLYVDFSVPVEELRQEAHRIIEASALWDRRDWVLQVVDVTEGTMVIRVLASAFDAPTSWDLRCEIREKLLGWLQATHPEALPRTRAEIGQFRGADEPYPDEPGARQAPPKEHDFTDPGTGRVQFAD